MLTSSQPTLKSEPKRERSSHPVRRFFQRFARHRIAVFMSILILIMMLTTFLAPLFAPYNPNQITSQLLAPPSREHWLGTDELGRDYFSRMLYGGRIPYSVALVSVPLSLLIGGVLGLIAAYFEGWVDSLIMRFIEFEQSFPDIFLLLILISMLGPSLPNMILALSIGGSASVTRLIRGAALSVKQNDYFTAAKALGANDIHILIRHLAPGLTSLMVLILSSNFGGSLLATSGLSFLGLGLPPPASDWGTMLDTGRNYISKAWWLITFPGIALTLNLLAWTFLGNALRDILDPKIKKF
jgi:peptide/nickel transport system permease protein